MRAGLFLAYWPWFHFEEQVALARAADRDGLDSVWIAEAWGQDAVSVCGYLASMTERVAIGTALMGGLGKPLRLLASPVQERIPIYLGAIGPKAVAQVAEIADGWLPFLVDPEDPGPLLDPFRAGLADAGRDPADVDVAAAVPVGLADDPTSLRSEADARAAVKPILAFYLGAMGARAKNFYVELADRAGFGDEARRVQELWLGRDPAGALAAVPDGLVDRMAIATTPAGLDDRLAAYADAGVDTLVCVPCGPDRPRIVEALAAATVA